MQLIRPGLGEVVDRLSILNLKVRAHGPDKVPEGLIEETHELLSYKVREFGKYLNEDVKKMEERLAGLNGRLWRAEEEIRALIEEQNNSEIAEVAKRICELNDARSVLIRMLNARVGIVTPPKIYTRGGRE